MTSYAEANYLQRLFENTEMMLAPQICLSMDEDVFDDQGIKPYQIKIRHRDKGIELVDVAGTLKSFNKVARTPEAKLKLLTNCAGIPEAEIESILSNITRMRELRLNLYTQWLYTGRPD